MAILAAYMVPHPPMIIPKIGRGGEKRISKTVRAYEEVADEIAALAPETIIITSPHSVMYADYFHISPGKRARGDFGQFGAPEVSFEEQYDTELVKAICDAADEQESFFAGTRGERDPKLDHGTMVPLWFIRRKLPQCKIVRIGLSGRPLTDHYMLGRFIRDAVEKTGRRAVFVASGDLSHKLQDYGPYGFAPEGPEYDRRIMDVCGQGAFGEMFDFDEHFLEKAAECGHRSFVIMAGALDGIAVEARQLSHEDVTGVGYGICTFHPGREDSSRRFFEQYTQKMEDEVSLRRSSSDEYVQLARDTIEAYILKRRRPERIPESLTQGKAGVFVSIHKQGALRGCIGTILPTRKNIAEEIISNAVNAATEDPRFPAIRPDELKWLDINVDVLTKPERIAGKDQLDVKRYGVIVTSGYKRGLLLPDLDGVDTVDQQVAIAMQKGGISSRDPVTLERFEVIRHR